MDDIYNSLPVDFRNALDESYRSSIRKPLDVNQIKAIYLAYRDENIQKKIFAEKIKISFSKIIDVKKKIFDYMEKEKIEFLSENDFKILKKIINKEK